MSKRYRPMPYDGVTARFVRNQRGSSSVEFAIVATPFIFLILFVLQMSVYYMAQSSLDAGVIQTADYLVNAYNSGTAPTITASSLNARVYAQSGGMIQTGMLQVDLKELSSLQAAPVAISNTVDSSGPGDVLALRAQGTVVTFMPGLQYLAVVRSSALLRRQGQ